MIELKQNSNPWIWVRLKRESDGVPLTGVVHGDLTITVWKSDNTQSAVSITGSDWTELTTGAFAGTGTYALRLPASTTTITGGLVYAVSTITSEPYLGTVKIVANEEVDTFAIVDTLRKYEQGRWKIHTSGADSGRLVIYDPIDNVTPVKKFDLLGEDGVTPAPTAPYEKKPV